MTNGTLGLTRDEYYTTIREDIDSGRYESIVTDPNNSEADINRKIADVYALEQSSWVWRRRTTDKELYSIISQPEGTEWSWTSYMSIPVTEQNAWQELLGGTSGAFGDERGLALEFANVRAAIDQIWPPETRTDQNAHIKRIGRTNATLGETLFFSGQHAGTAADPEISDIQGNPITANDVRIARSPEYDPVILASR